MRLSEQYGDAHLVQHVCTFWRHMGVSCPSCDSQHRLQNQVCFHGCCAGPCTRHQRTLIMASSAPVTTLEPCWSNSTQNTGKPCPLNVAWCPYRAADVRSGSRRLLLPLHLPPSRSSSCCARLLARVGCDSHAGICLCAGSCRRVGKAARGPSASRVDRPCRQGCVRRASITAH